MQPYIRARTAKKTENKEEKRQSPPLSALQRVYILLVYASF